MALQLGIWSGRYILSNSDVGRWKDGLVKMFGVWIWSKVMRKVAIITRKLAVWKLSLKGQMKGANAYITSDIY